MLERGLRRYVTVQILILFVACSRHEQPGGEPTPSAVTAAPVSVASAAPSPNAAPPAPANDSALLKAVKPFTTMLSDVSVFNSADGYIEIWGSLSCPALGGKEEIEYAQSGAVAALLENEKGKKFLSAHGAIRGIRIVAFRIETARDKFGNPQPAKKVAFARVSASAEVLGKINAAHAGELMHDTYGAGCLCPVCSMRRPCCYTLLNWAKGVLDIS